MEVESTSIQIKLLLEELAILLSF